VAERGQWASSWVSLAEKFPHTLAKDIAPEALENGQVPDAYGMGLDKKGFLYVESSVPDGTVWNGIATVSAPTDAPATATWRFSHGRLWGWSALGTTLFYGAYGYTNDYLIQGLGYVPVDSQESAVIVQVVPFGNSIAIFKASALYVIKNADAPSGNFIAEYVKQSSGISVVGEVVAMNDVLYWCNASGVWSFDGNQIVELTKMIRNNLGTFASDQIVTLRADFSRNEIIGRGASDTKFIIVPSAKPELYDYSTDGFKFVTRTLVGEEGEPLLVDKIGFIYQYSTSEQATVDFGVKINDKWKNEDQLKIRPANDNGWAEMGLTNVLACRKFALRITGMSSGLYISKILIHVKQGGGRGYSAK